MKILTRFLARRFIESLLLVLAVVCGIIFVTSFMQEIAGAPTVLDALDMSFAHFLELFPMFLPLAVFMATLLAFYKLLMSSELVIIQSAGWSAFRIMQPMIWAAAILGVITAAVINPLSTRYSAHKIVSSRIERIDNAVWVREKTNDGGIVIRAADITDAPDDGLEFADATLIRENKKHQITERIDAKNMTLRGGKLSAKNALILDFQGIEQTRDFTAETSLDPENIIRQYLKPNQVSFWELPGFIRTLKTMGVPTIAHSLQFLSLLFLPIGLVSMTLLGAVFSQTKQRRRISLVRQFGLGIITSFAVYFIIQIFNAIGLSGGMHPVLAIFFPPAIVLFFAATSIVKSDNM